MMPPTVFPGDPLKNLEDEAYDAAEGAEPAREYGDYSQLGPAIYQRPFRPGVLRQWPIHTDFRPDNVEVGG
jgi:hypothetical protein